LEFLSPANQRSIANIFRRWLLVPATALISCSIAFAQSAPASGPARQPAGTGPSPSPMTTASAAVTDKPSPEGTLAKPGYLTPIRGLQGVLAETIDGATVASQSIDERFNPASTIKLATSVAALRSFGPNYRFVTSLWITGTVDPTTGTLYGDLILTGGDPSFHSEHAVMIARQLNQLGIETVAGNLIVAPSFRMNFDWSARSSGQQLYDALDVARRPATATKAWIDERTLLGDTRNLQVPPSVAVQGGVTVGPVPSGAMPLLVHKSSKLVDVLKAMLCYSNNFMAERIGETLGGPETVRAVVTSQFKIDPEEFMISSTSGLGVNRVTPRAMMKVLRGLQTELAKNNLTLSDILPVAGVDPGTLQDRYTSDLLRGSVIAKTGTLGRTDGGASSLVGQAQTKSGKIVLFVIMNQQGNVLRFRENQDEIVNQLQNAFGGPAPFKYHPVALSMRLSDSDYEAARRRGEYEPKN
jgi:serine-type D-Ala-D-Ala carboxypeptidase/endopeptidase (penicillin-binding protein 4)